MYTAPDVIAQIIDISNCDRSVPVLSLHCGDINVLPIRIHCPLLSVTPHQLFYVASEASKPIHARIVVIPVLLRILLLLPLYSSWLLLWNLLCLLFLLLLLLTCSGSRIAFIEHVLFLLDLLLVDFFHLLQVRAIFDHLHETVPAVRASDIIIIRDEHLLE